MPLVAYYVTGGIALLCIVPIQALGKYVTEMVKHKIITLQLCSNSIFHSFIHSFIRSIHLSVRPCLLVSFLFSSLACLLLRGGFKGGYSDRFCGGMLCVRLEPLTLSHTKFWKIGTLSYSKISDAGTLSHAISWKGIPLTYLQPQKDTTFTNLYLKRDPFPIPPTWKRYPFRAKHLHIAHYREFPLWVWSFFHCSLACFRSLFSLLLSFSSCHFLMHLVFVYLIINSSDY